jgi:nitroreductase
VQIVNVLDAIRQRRSVRSFSTQPIPDEVMQRMREAIRSAPSACNYQPWQFVLVEEDRLRRQLAAASSDQVWMADAPVTVVACGFPDRAYQTMGGSGNSVEIDVAIALDHLTLAAVADHLGTCWIGAFSEATVKQLLGIPRNVKVVAMTPLGYPSSPDLNHPLKEGQRKSENEVFSVDRYSGSIK